MKPWRRSAHVEIVVAREVGVEDELLDHVGAHVEQDVQPELEVVVEVVLAARADDGLIARVDPHLVLACVSSQ